MTTQAPIPQNTAGTQSVNVYEVRLCECGCERETPLATTTRRRLGTVKGQPIRFLQGHARRQTLTFVEAFWSKVDKDGPVPEHKPELGPCWLWTAGQNGEGYGFTTALFRMLAHRFAYELLVGPIPEGLQLDHLCRVRNCVRPDHLEPVTNRVNVQRGARGSLVTHCPAGHEYDEANTYYAKRDGHRVCRTCRRERIHRIQDAAYWRRWRAAKREAQAA